MKRGFMIILIAVISIVLLTIILIGWIGIKKEINLEDSGCKESYTHYIVTPFMHDSLECVIITPCGTYEKVGRSNAYVRLIQCLCEDKDNNRESIISNFDFLLKTDEIFSRDMKEGDSGNITFICTWGAREYKLM
jgi:hypothetical protein